MNVAVFPLTANVLPEGKMPLRIFEPRYLRMVAEATRNQQPIAMAMLKTSRNLPDNENLHDIVTLCEITDFSQLDDGLLGIEVEGRTLAKRGCIVVDSDGLRRAEVHPLEMWPEQQRESTFLEPLAARLKTIFDEYPEVGSLYQSTTRLDDLKWVCCRWIEMLPLSSEVKTSLIQQDVHQVAIYLDELFTQS